MILKGFNQCFANVGKIFRYCFSGDFTVKLTFCTIQAHAQISENSLLAISKWIRSTSSFNGEIQILLYKEYFRLLGGIITHICKKV